MVLAVFFAALLLVGSEAGAAPPPLPLREAIALAQRTSPTHSGAAAVAHGADIAASAAGRLLNPLLDIRTENWTPSSSQLPLDIWATVSQPVELGGKRSLRRGVATAERDGAVADLAAIDRRIALDTTRQYLLALRARALLESLVSNRDGLSTVVQTLRARVGEGYVAEADLLRVQAEAARLDIDIARASLDLSRSLDTLTALVGAAQPIEPSQLVIPDPMAPPAPGDATAIAAAVALHPELRAASARVARAEQVQALERAKRLPDPAITTGFKRTLGISTVVAAVTTTIPLFDRNGVAGATSAASVQAAVSEREQTRLRLTAELTTLMRTARTLAMRAADARDDLLAPAEIVREAARSAFREGSADILKLIDAERVYGDVRRVAIDLQLEAVASTIEARIALGEEPLP